MFSILTQENTKAAANVPTPTLAQNSELVSEPVLPSNEIKSSEPVHGKEPAAPSSEDSAEAPEDKEEPGISKFMR